MSDWPAPRATPLIKVCGITKPELAEAAVSAGADMIGLVHFAPSPRHLDFDAAREVAAAAKGAIVVSLSVNADDATLDQINTLISPHVYQLHGRETPEHVESVAERYGKPVIKAVGVSEPADIASAVRYDALLLLDAKPPKDATRPGGNGEVFDWSILSAMPEGRPFMLSGGLRPDNVGAAVQAVRPYAVDVSSGVETDRVKDPTKITAFITAVRTAAAGEAA